MSILKDNYIIDLTKPIKVLAEEIMALPFYDACQAMLSLNLIDFNNGYKTEYAAYVARYVYANLPQYKKKLDKIRMNSFV